MSPPHLQTFLSSSIVTRSFSFRGGAGSVAGSTYGPEKNLAWLARLHWHSAAGKFSPCSRLSVDLLGQSLTSCCFFALAGWWDPPCHSYRLWPCWRVRVLDGRWGSSHPTIPPGWQQCRDAGHYRDQPPRWHRSGLGVQEPLLDWHRHRSHWGRVKKHVAVIPVCVKAQTPQECSQGFRGQSVFSQQTVRW